MDGTEELPISPHQQLLRGVLGALALRSSPPAQISSWRGEFLKGWHWRAPHFPTPVAGEGHSGIAWTEGLLYGCLLLRLRALGRLSLWLRAWRRAIVLDGTRKLSKDPTLTTCQLVAFELSTMHKGVRSLKWVCMDACAWVRRGAPGQCPRRRWCFVHHPPWQPMGVPCADLR